MSETSEKGETSEMSETMREDPAVCQVPRPQ